MKLFEINSPPQKKGFDFPEIVRNERVLLYYDFPMVYVGENRYGNIVIGYWVGYDEENDIERYYHVVLDADTYHKYLRKEITLLDILKANPIYIMDYKPDGTYTVYIVSIKDIPEFFLPPEESYYPGEEIESDKIITRINIPEHYMESEKIYAIIEGTNEILKSAFEPLSARKPEIFVSAPQPGSFLLEYVMKFAEAQSVLFPEYDARILADTAADYLKLLGDKFLIESLPDIQKVNEWLDLLRSKPNIPYISRFKDLFQSQDIEKIRKVIKKIFSNMEKANQATLEIAELVPKNRKLYIYKGHPLSNPLIEISGYKKDVFENIYQTILEKSGHQKTELRNEEFEILIYHLNILSRTGNAYIYSRVNQQKLDKPRIKILGDFELSGSVFTRSLHESMWIKVRGNAKLVDGKFRYIEIEEGIE